MNFKNIKFFITQQSLIGYAQKKKSILMDRKNKKQLKVKEVDGMDISEDLRGELRKAFLSDLQTIERSIGFCNVIIENYVNNNEKVELDVNEMNFFLNHEVLNYELHN